jgi:hypothetical protein
VVRGHSRTIALWSSRPPFTYDTTSEPCPLCRKGRAHPERCRRCAGRAGSSVCPGRRRTETRHGRACSAICVQLGHVPGADHDAVALSGLRLELLARPGPSGRCGGRRVCRPTAPLHAVHRAQVAVGARPIRSRSLQPTRSCSHLTLLSRTCRNHSSSSDHRS